jgi:hypothetical protein
MVSAYFPTPGAGITDGKGEPLQVGLGLLSGLKANSFGMGYSKRRSDNSNDSEGMWRKRETIARTITTTTSYRTFAEAASLPPMNGEPRKRGRVRHERRYQSEERKGLGTVGRDTQTRVIAFKFGVRLISPSSTSPKFEVGGRSRGL